MEYALSVLLSPNGMEYSAHTREETLEIGVWAFLSQFKLHMVANAREVT